MLAPLKQRLSMELRTVVHANGRGQAPPLGQFCQLFYDRFTGNALDAVMLRASRLVIDDVERPEGRFQPERIA